MNTTEKATPTTVESKKVAKSMPIVIETEKVINVDGEVAPEKGTTEKEVSIRFEETKAIEPNLLDKTEKVASPPNREAKCSNPTGQIQYVLADLRRTEEEQVTRPSREPVNVDVECALAAQLEEQGQLGVFVRLTNQLTELF